MIAFDDDVDGDPKPPLPPPSFLALHVSSRPPGAPPGPHLSLASRPVTVRTPLEASNETCLGLTLFFFFFSRLCRCCDVGVGVAESEEETARDHDASSNDAGSGSDRTPSTRTSASFGQGPPEQLSVVVGFFFLCDFEEEERGSQPSPDLESVIRTPPPPPPPPLPPLPLPPPLSPPPPPCSFFSFPCSQPETSAQLPFESAPASSPRSPSRKERPHATRGEEEEGEEEEDEDDEGEGEDEDEEERGA